MKEMNKSVDTREDGRIMKNLHMKMPIAKRAKQFMPFSALSGLEAALAKKEIEIEKKYEDMNNMVIDYQIDSKF